MDANQTEAVVARFHELADGQMKRVQVGDKDVLLVRLGGQFHAVAATCPHWGGPLAEGTLVGESGDCVVCPWHKSRFNLKTGDQVEPPALDGLARYEVRVEGQDVIVRVERDQPDAEPPPLALPDRRVDQRTFVIVGAGAAGTMAAQTLREVGFRGRLLMFTDDPRPPYDRPKCSKQYLSGEESAEGLPLRLSDFYAHGGIEVQHRRVTSVGAASRTILCADGDALVADGLLLATGAAPRRLGVPGEELANVCLLRRWDDADAIVAAAGGSKHILVVGASFIGMEAAASLTERFGKHAAQVTVVAPGPEPFARRLGLQVGRLFRLLHEEHGVKFLLGAKVARFEGDGRVQAAVLADGQRLPADLVVVGVGVQPATQYLQDVPRNPDGSVTVDTHLRLADKVYAAGDLATFPDPRTGALIRIEHWRVAQQQGRVAALNLMGRVTEFDAVPYFWTYQFQTGLDYLGHADDWDDLVIDGDLAQRRFIAYYVRRGVVLAAAAIGRDADLVRLAERWCRGERVSTDDLHRPPGRPPVGARHRRREERAAGRRPEAEGRRVAEPKEGTAEPKEGERGA